MKFRWPGDVHVSLAGADASILFTRIRGSELIDQVPL
jgi:hypothetical protein